MSVSSLVILVALVFLDIAWKNGQTSTNAAEHLTGTTVTTAVGVDNNI